MTDFAAEQIGLALPIPELDRDSLLWALVTANASVVGPDGLEYRVQDVDNGGNAQYYLLEPTTQSGLSSDGADELVSLRIDEVLENLDTYLPPDIQTVVGLCGFSSLRKYQSMREKMGAQAALEAFRANPTPVATDWYRHDNLHDVVGFLAGVGDADPDILSVGCASGQEPYSLASLLLGAEIGGHVTGIDVTPDILYGEKALAVQADEVGQEVLDMVSFERHDILAGAFGEGYDAAVCNNVLYHYKPDARDVIIENILGGLTPGAVVSIDTPIAHSENQEYADWQQQLPERFPLQRLDAGDSVLFAYTPGVME